MPSTLRRLVLAAAAATLAGCAAMGDRGRPLVPSEFQTRTGPFVVFTSEPIAADDPAVRQLQALKDEFEGTLGLKAEAADHPIEVYVLGDRKAFEHFLNIYYPTLPTRRAFFIAQDNRRVVYTFRSDRLDEDIRHEATHALVHLAIGRIPLWLDEGLAEHFEVVDGSGANRDHLGKLPADMKDGWTPDLAKLETLQSVQDMSPRDYRESWAWVHYLLHGPPEGRAQLLAYLGTLRKDGEARPLSTRLAGEPPARVAALRTHLTAVAAAPPRPPVEGAVRLQDRPIEVDPPPKKRSFLSRLFGK